MPVGFGLGDEIGADDAARSPTVFDDHGAVDFLPELLGEEPGDNVYSAARHGRHDEHDGFGRALLRLSAWRDRLRDDRGGEQRKGAGLPKRASAHRSLLLASSALEILLDPGIPEQF